MASEAASLRLEVNWQKTKVQALAAGRMSHRQSQFYGRRFAVVEEFVYHGCLIHLITQNPITTT